MRPSYASAEIDAAASINKDVDYLFKQAEKILDRLLSPSDFEMIYSFVDWLGLPVEVVIMLLTFVAGLIPSRVAANKDPVTALRTE